MHDVHDRWERLSEQAEVYRSLFRKAMAEGLEEAFVHASTLGREGDTLFCSQCHRDNCRHIRGLEWLFAGGGNPCDGFVFQTATDGTEYRGYLHYYQSRTILFASKATEEGELLLGMLEMDSNKLVALTQRGNNLRYRLEALEVIASAEL